MISGTWRLDSYWIFLQDLEMKWFNTRSIEIILSPYTLMNINIFPGLSLILFVRNVDKTGIPHYNNKEVKYMYSRR